MYSLYRREDTRFLFDRQISLFGCNSGWIPALLKSKLTPTDSECLEWELDVRERLEAQGHSNRSIIIDIKPQSSDPNSLFICELTHVWGVSDHGWTPLLLRLAGLFVDEALSSENKFDFVAIPKEDHESIFTFLYAAGTVLNGEIVGKWIAPKASPTNGALLWPGPLTHFRSAIDRFQRPAQDDRVRSPRELTIG